MSPLSELSFTISASSPTSNSVLHLKNTHSSRISFKIKTTAPDAYLVRPTLGVLEPSQNQTVVITLKTHHVAGIDKHKFSIQSRETSLEPSDLSAITTLWAEKSREGVQQVILKAVATTAEEPKTPLSASISVFPVPSSAPSTAPSTASSETRPSIDAKSQLSELTRANVYNRQQALQTEKSDLEMRLKSLRNAADSTSEISFTTFQLLLVLLLGLVLGTALLS